MTLPAISAMFRLLIRHGKFNSACVSVSNLMLKLDAQLPQTLTLAAALVLGCLSGSPVTGAAEGWSADSTLQVRSDLNRNCPSRNDLDIALGNASSLMSQARNQDAAALLEPLARTNCDARVSLLLAAAFEGQGDKLKATTVLDRAHSVWPSNNSIAASLARVYLANGQKDQAAKALAHFRPTGETPEQELEMAVVVYLASNQLLSAQKVAEQDFRSYPSVHSLLLVANALQMQGRSTDVIRLLGLKRGTYADSPEFLVTLAESELDASLNPAAREDLQHAIALNPNLYQEHYLLGNVLSRTNDVEGALTEYRLAISLAPDQPRTYYQMALVLRSKQDDAGEQQALEQALASDDHYAPAHCELGRMLVEAHRPEDAVGHLLLAIQYNPRFENAYFQLVKAYTALGEKDKAEQMVQRLQAVRKENRPGQNSKSISGSSGDESPSR
jgi:tetratricopeptide (TPR) repeat protein